ncbi:MAG: ureidoglycolate lyase [Rhodospirillaceae bacterium TMED167]|nr:ureidoglycolate lyase [Rhodospirillaceae bacterium]OUW31457.1 MAG: ureidoglycolate lyase [Rhodospirillaceae bacterium TMED167]
MLLDLDIHPLTRETFAPFGDVITASGAETMSINEGTTQRFHNLAKVDVTDEDGGILLNIFRGQPRKRPIQIRMMECHPLGSQAFYPLQPHPYLIVAAKTDGPPTPTDLHAFRATGTQGINYAKSIWHHPLLVLEPNHDFMVVDRGGPGINLDEHWFPDAEGGAQLTV